VALGSTPVPIERLPYFYGFVLIVSCHPTVEIAKVSQLVLVSRTI
jgi:hypothetical protein